MHEAKASTDSMGCTFEVFCLSKQTPLLVCGLLVLIHFFHPPWTCLVELLMKPIKFIYSIKYENTRCQQVKRKIKKNTVLKHNTVHNQFLKFNEPCSQDDQHNCYSLLRRNLGCKVEATQYYRQLLLQTCLSRSDKHFGQSDFLQ